jgi:hypothetical protein
MFNYSIILLCKLFAKFSMSKSYQYFYYENSENYSKA